MVNGTRPPDGTATVTVAGPESTPRHTRSALTPAGAHSSPTCCGGNVTASRAPTPDAVRRGGTADTVMSRHDTPMTRWSVERINRYWLIGSALATVRRGDMIFAHRRRGRSGTAGSP